MLHIELTRWADCLLIAPLSANYMAKLALGLCDDLLTSVVRAWPPDKHILLVPAVHHALWRHPVTCPQLEVLSAIPNYWFLSKDGLAPTMSRCQTPWRETLPAPDAIAEALQSMQDRVGKASESIQL